MQVKSSEIEERIMRAVSVFCTVILEIYLTKKHRKPPNGIFGRPNVQDLAFIIY
jgi:hypothetical protein